MLRFVMTALLLITGTALARADAYEDCQALSGLAALQACDEAIAQEPNDARLYNSRGLEHSRRKAHDRALADFARSIELDPAFSDAYINRGSVYDDLGDFDHALADYAKAVALEPGSALAHNNRCYLRAKFNREPQLGLSDCNTAIGLDAEEADYRDSRALLYVRLDRLDDALADYDAALRLDPQLATALYGRGVVKDMKGDMAGAAADKAAAAALNPDIAAEFAKLGLR